jgi:quinol-cytochrome oxidoreductase complex cytochrome b subunit
VRDVAPRTKQVTVKKESEKEEKKSIVQRLWSWFDSRAKLSSLPRVDVPLHATNPIYCLGGITFLAFMIQGVTGMLLAVYYKPSLEIVPGTSHTEAYHSVTYIMEEVRYGALVRTLHSYTANLMVFTGLLHMFRVFFTGGYKAPRELNWVAGLSLGMITLTFGFTGYLLPWTDMSRGATTIGIGMMKSLPEIGPLLSSVVTGTTDADTLKRFFAFHTLILPGIFAILLLAHAYMIKKHGISGSM